MHGSEQSAKSVPDPVHGLLVHGLLLLLRRSNEPVRHQTSREYPGGVVA